MAFSVDQGNFTKSTAGAPVDQAITGVGFVPKALILWQTPQTSAGTTAHMMAGMGVSDGTTDHAVHMSAQDAATITNIDTRHAAKISTITNQIGTLLAEADLKSFDADGFTLTWTTNNGSAYIIHYLALGGDDLTNVDVNFFTVKSGTGSQSITGVGFKPDAMITLGNQIGSDPPGTISNASMTVGMTSGEGLGGDQKTIGMWSKNAGLLLFGTTTETRKGAAGGRVYTDGTASQAGQGGVDTFDNDGFTLDWGLAPVANSRCGFLALKGGQYHVAKEDARNSTTGTKAYTGYGFQPNGLFIIQSQLAGGWTSHSLGGIGGVSGVGTDGAIWWGDEDAVTTTVSDKHTSTTKCVRHGAPGGATLAEADLDSFDSDGYTLDWTTVDASGRAFFTLAFGDAAAGVTHIRQGVSLGSANVGVL